MKLSNIFETNLDEAINELGKASASGGMFISLKDDGDHYFCVMMEVPQIYMHKGVWKGVEKTSKRAKGNWAVFEKVEGTDDFAYDRLAIWDNVDPKKYKALLTDIKEFGQKKLYKLQRVGKKDDPKTQYRVYPQRDLTAEEMTMLHSLTLLSLHKDDTDAGWVDVAKEDIAKELQRLGWTVDEQYPIANKKFFGGDVVQTADMTIAQRTEFLQALRALEPGADPTTIGAVLSGEELNLDEDADFFGGGTDA